MGDPECQVILPRLDTDLVKILKAVTDNQINKIKNKLEKQKVYDYCIMFQRLPWKL